MSFFMRVNIREKFEDLRDCFNTSNFVKTIKIMRNYPINLQVD